MRTTLVLFTLLCFQQAAFAQKYQSFGISYAPTLARINDFSGKATGPRYGQQACLIFQWKTSSTFSYRIGLGYSYLQAAKSYNQLFTNDLITTWSRHHDIILPFLLQFSFSSRPNRLFLTGGVVPSINLGRKVTESSQSPYSTYVFERDITAAQNYQWVDVPVSLGIGYEIKPKNMGRFYLQPVFRSNLLTQLVFIPKALFGRRSPEPEIPTSVNTFGVELGYFLK